MRCTGSTRYHSSIHPAQDRSSLSIREVTCLKSLLQNSVSSELQPSNRNFTSLGHSAYRTTRWRRITPKQSSPPGQDRPHSAASPLSQRHHLRRLHLSLPHGKPESHIGLSGELLISTAEVNDTHGGWAMMYLLTEQAPADQVLHMSKKVNKLAFKFDFNGKTLLAEPDDRESLHEAMIRTIGLHTGAAVSECGRCKHREGTYTYPIILENGQRGSAVFTSEAA